MLQHNSFRAFSRDKVALGGKGRLDKRKKEEKQWCQGNRPNPMSDLDAGGLWPSRADQVAA
jgi:hypothetical protein